MPWGREPFLSAWPLLAVAVFALNNFWLKWAYPGWFAGKLSDFCACFFIPLYIAWMLAEFGARDWPIQRRVAWGVWVTVIVFAGVKATTFGSHALNTMVGAITAGLPLDFAPNHTDTSDLVALPMSLVAAWFAAWFARTQPTGTTRAAAEAP